MAKKSSTKDKSPEVLDGIPQVPKKKPPITKTTGKIQEIIQNPEVKKKWLEKMRGNLFALRTGQYAKVPYYCNDCVAKHKCPFYQEPKEKEDKVLCALHKDFIKWFTPDEFEYREQNIVNETRDRLMNVLLTRAGFNLWIETMFGGSQDKELTKLLFGIWDRISNRPTIQQNTFVNINLQIAEAINNLDETSRRKIIEILRKPEDEDRQE